MKDRVTPKERLEALLSGEKLDRIPFIPFTLGFCAKNVGYPLASMYHDPEKSFWAQLWTQEQYGYDGYPLYGYASYGAWEFDGFVQFPTDGSGQAPTIECYIVQTEEDAEKLGLPDLREAGMLPQAMKFSKISKKMEMPVSILMGGVFTIAGNLCGADKLCRWMIDKPELAYRLIQLAAKHIVSVVQLWVDTFSSENLIVHIGEPLASNQLISPRHFEEFVFPYQKGVHENILAMGVKHILCHICGEHNLNLPYWAQIPMGDPGIISIGDEVDITKAIEYFGDSCVIAGNIKPSIIQTGTAQEVYELCRIAIEKGKNAPVGYILMSGCEVPPQTPPYNMYMMTKAVQEFGWYD